mgnify:CR=1 FL=1
MTFSDVFLRYAEQHTWVRLAPSAIHGVGVFAIRPIPAFCDPFPDCQNLFHRIPLECLPHLPEPVQKMMLDYLYNDEEYVWVPDLTLNQLNISFFLNSSEHPNCEHHENGRITTLRDIEVGEELTHYYEV